MPKGNPVAWMGETSFEYKFEDDTNDVVMYSLNKIDGIETRSSSEMVKIDLVGEEWLNLKSYLLKFRHSKLA